MASFRLNNCHPYALWPVQKKYFAAHCFLHGEKSLRLSAAYCNSLNSLHLQVKYGAFSPELIVPELKGCPKREKLRREFDWEKFFKLSRVSAMKRFIDILDENCANWFKTPQIELEFEMDWATRGPDFTELSTPCKSCTLHIKQSHSITSITAKHSKNSVRPLTKSKIHDLTTESKYYLLPGISPKTQSVSVANSYKILFSTLDSAKPTPELPESAKTKCTKLLKNFEIALETVSEQLTRSEECSELIHGATFKETLLVLYAKEDLFAFEKLVKPGLNSLSQIVQGLETTLGHTSDSLKTLLFKHSRGLDATFEFIKHLHKTLEDERVRRLRAEALHKTLREGLKCICELNEEDNKNFNLFGVLKLTTEEYVNTINLCKETLPYEDASYLLSLEQLLAGAAGKTSELTRELCERDQEIDSIKDKFSEIQKRGHKYSSYLSSQCRNMKESIGLLQGTQEADSAFNEQLNEELHSLQKENATLSLQNIELQQQLTRSAHHSKRLK